MSLFFSCFMRGGGRMLTWDTLVPLLVKFYNSTVRYQNQNESVNSALSGYYDRPTADEPTTPDQQTNQETKRSDHRKFTHREQPIANELKIRAPFLLVLGGGKMFLPWGECW